MAIINALKNNVLLHKYNDVFTLNYEKKTALIFCRHFTVNRWLGVFSNIHFPGRPLVKSVYHKINFLISQPKHMLWVLKMRRSF